MNDAEREAQIRLRAEYPNLTATAGQQVLAADIAVLLRLLDEARAILITKNSTIGSLEDEIDKLDEEIVRLTAPSDRLDEAARAIDHIKSLGFPTEPPFESREMDWQTCCDRCRATVLMLRLSGPGGRHPVSPSDGRSHDDADASR